VSATNLITQQLLSGTIIVAPQSKVILYLSSATDSNLLPATPLALNAVGSAMPKVTLDWNPTSGALGYNLKRSLTKGGPYATIANVTGANYVDTGVGAGSVYYYFIAATNIVGTPNLPGKADYADGSFLVTGNGVDIGNTSDAFHFVYQNMTATSGSLGVRVAAMDSGAVGEKVGVMMRASTNANSMAAFLMYDTSSGFHCAGWEQARA